MTMLAPVMVLVLSLPFSWSLTSLEKIALEMEHLHWNFDSLEMESFTKLAVSPSDRKLFESAKSYVGTGYYSS